MIYTSFNLLIELGCKVFFSQDTEVDIQIAHYVALCKDGPVSIVGTDYDFFGLVKTECRIFSPVTSDSWFLDTKEFRRVVSERADTTLSPLDIFVIYNLAPNDNMNTRIKGLGFVSALKRFAEWLSKSRLTGLYHRLGEYRNFLVSLTDDQGKVESILEEMKAIHTAFGWSNADQSILNSSISKDATDAPRQSM